MPVQNFVLAISEEANTWAHAETHCRKRRQAQGSRERGGGRRRTMRVMEIMVPAVPLMKDASLASVNTSTGRACAATERVGWGALQKGGPLRQERARVLCV